MQFLMNQRDLVAALDAVKPSLSRRSTIPILMTVKISVRSFAVTFATTNLECRSEYTAITEKCEDGETTVNHAELLALVKPLAGEVLRFQLVEDKLVISSDTLSVSLDTLDPEEFPTGPRANQRQPGDTWEEMTISGETIVHHVTSIDTQVASLKVAAFRRAIDLVGYAAADDFSRPALTGLYMHLEKEELTLAAANAFRLCLMSLPVSGGDPWHFPILVPAKAVAEVVKKFPKQEEIILGTTYTTTITRTRDEAYTPETTAQFATFTAGRLTVDIRLIDETFPDFRRLLPQESTTTATLPASALARALKAVEPIVKDASNITRLHFNGGIEIKAQRDGMEQPMIIMVPAQIAGSELEIIHNHYYLNQIVAANLKAQVTLSLTSPTKPTAITYDNEPGFVGVVMPMHVNR